MAGHCLLMDLDRSVEFLDTWFEILLERALVDYVLKLMHLTEICFFS